jgi:hypothetical protein
LTTHKLADLCGVSPETLSAGPASTQLQSYVRQSLSVLAEAMRVNSDEGRVLHRFRDQRLPEFEMKTPAALVSESKTVALLSYIGSIEA